MTQFHVEPGVVERAGTDGMKQWKVRVAQISSLSDDLALALSANKPVALLLCRDLMWEDA